eukprot:Filipodium_phascolosomae@DN2694_c0_g1_i1.p1
MTKIVPSLVLLLCIVLLAFYNALREVECLNLRKTNVQGEDADDESDTVRDEVKEKALAKRRMQRVRLLEQKRLKEMARLETTEAYKKLREKHNLPADLWKKNKMHDTRIDAVTNKKQVRRMVKPRKYRMPKPGGYMAMLGYDNISDESDYEWVNEDELTDLEAIPGLLDEE